MNRYNDKEYARELNNLVDEIFNEAYDSFNWSWGELANAAGLSMATVYRIGNRETQLPSHRTIFRLAKAVGMKLRLVAVVAKLKKAS